MHRAAHHCGGIFLKEAWEDVLSFAQLYSRGFFSVFSPSPEPPMWFEGATSSAFRAATTMRTPGQLTVQGTALSLRPWKFLLARVVGQWAQGLGLVNEESERLVDRMLSY